VSGMVLGGRVVPGAWGVEGRSLLSVWTLVVFITTAAFVGVVFGWVEGGLAFGGAVVALSGVVVGALAPAVLLRALFLTAPVVWGVGDLFAWSSVGRRLNLPMLVGFFVVCAFGRLLLVRDPDTRVERVRKLVLTLAIVCVPAVFFASDLSTGVGTYLRIIEPFLIMFAVRRYIRNDADLLATVRIMAWSLASTLVLFVVAYWRGELWVPFDGYVHLGGMNLPPQSVASYLTVMVAVLGLGYFAAGRWVYVALVLPVLACLYLTLNRTAWVGCALLFFLFLRRIGRRRAWVLVGVLLLFGLASSGAIDRAFLRGGGGLETAGEVNKLFSGRLLVDAVNIENYLNASVGHKLFGIGLLRSLDVTGSVLGDRLEIHSDYLAFLIEAGVFGLVVYLSVLVAIWMCARRAAKSPTRGVRYWVCAVACDAVLMFIVMGVPRAWYHEVLGNMYFFSLMGMMLWAFAHLKDSSRSGYSAFG
jgi:O-Antigen ligase